MPVERILPCIQRRNCYRLSDANGAAIRRAFAPRHDLMKNGRAHIVCPVRRYGADEARPCTLPARHTSHKPRRAPPPPPRPPRNNEQLFVDAKKQTGLPAQDPDGEERSDAHAAAERRAVRVRQALRVGVRLLRGGALVHLHLVGHGHVGRQEPAQQGAARYGARRAGVGMVRRGAQPQRRCAAAGSGAPGGAGGMGSLAPYATVGFRRDAVLGGPVRYRG